MEYLDSLLCLFNGRVKRRNGSYVVEVQEQELDVGAVDEGQAYKIGVFPAPATETEDPDTDDPTIQEPPSRQAGKHQQSLDEPPVEDGDIREAEIEDIGEKGDGLARIGPGYVVFVEETQPGDRVKIRVTEARDNFAFAEVVDRV